jgi:hypothetical protein
MAEAIAAVSVIASILQIIDISGRVLDSLVSYNTNLKEVPEAFRSISDVLPLLRDVLKKTKQSIDADQVPRETVAALLPVVSGCSSRIHLLDQMLMKSLPKKDSWTEKAKKSIYTVKVDSALKNVIGEVLRCVNVLTFYYAASNSTPHLGDGMS